MCLVLMRRLLIFAASESVGSALRFLESVHVLTHLSQISLEALELEEQTKR